MATCKDCLYVDICDYTSGTTETACGHFKDSSKFVELPCKVGDCLYALFPKSNAVVEYVVIAFWIEESGVIIRVVDTRFFTTTIFFIKDIGTKAFLTKQEAKQAVKERESSA